MLGSVQYHINGQVLLEVAVIQMTVIAVVQGGQVEAAMVAIMQLYASKDYVRMCSHASGMVIQ